jgi:hypothetical protein
MTREDIIEQYELAAAAEAVRDQLDNAGPVLDSVKIALAALNAARDAKPGWESRPRLGSQHARGHKQKHSAGSCDVVRSDTEAVPVSSDAGAASPPDVAGTDGDEFKSPAAG